MLSHHCIFKFDSSPVVSTWLSCTTVIFLCLPSSHSFSQYLPHIFFWNWFFHLFPSFRFSVSFNPFYPFNLIYLLLDFQALPNTYYIVRFLFNISMEHEYPEYLCSTSSGKLQNIILVVFALTPCKGHLKKSLATFSTTITVSTVVSLSPYPTSKQQHYTSLSLWIASCFFRSGFICSISACSLHLAAYTSTSLQFFSHTSLDFLYFPQPLKKRLEILLLYLYLNATNFPQLQGNFAWWDILIYDSHIPNVIW